MKNKPFVLCVAAWIGGGKTTLVNELLNHLPRSKAIYFDSYRNITWRSFPAQNYYQWSISGNDYNEWNLEPIADDIENLLQEELDFILLEIPMGKANKMIAQYIDCCVYLDVPIDILLARLIIRDYCKRSPDKRKLDNPMESLFEHMTDYVSHRRITVFNYIEKVKPLADYIVDGYQPIEKLVDDVLLYLNKKLTVTTL